MKLAMCLWKNDRHRARVGSAERILHRQSNPIRIRRGIRVTDNHRPVQSAEVLRLAVAKIHERIDYADARWGSHLNSEVGDERVSVRVRNCWRRDVDYRRAGSHDGHG